MSQNTPLFERSQAGKREDLADYISLVDAKDTPIISMIPKGSKPGNTLLEWQADSMPDAVSTGSVDGVDVTGYENLNYKRAKIQNYIQVFQRAIRVSPLAVDVSVVAGLRDELAGMVAKGIKLLKRDMELTVSSDNGAQADDGTDPYKTRGLGEWIVVAADKDTVLPPPSDFCPLTGSINTTAMASFSEADPQAVLTAIYGQTGSFKEYDCVVGTTLKRAFSNLLFTTGITTTSTVGVTGSGATAIRTFNRDASSDAYIASVDIFEGDFGRLKLHPSLFMPNVRRGYVLDMDLLELRYTNMPEVRELPDAGGGPARLIKAVAGLVVKNPLGLGKFAAAS
jgi:hypothetical protein